MKSHSGRENEKNEVGVRTSIGNYAYEVTSELCAEGEALGHWDYKVYKVTPAEVLSFHGEVSPNREHAERNARQLIALSIELDRMEVMQDFMAA